MFLSKEEERILSGEHGEVLREALTAIVKVGEIMGAESLIDVVHAHVSGISYFNIGDPGVEFIESLAVKGASFSVFTTANPYAVIQGFKHNNFKMDIIKKQERVVNALIKMGAKAFTCAPYFVREPKVGEHLAWAESNAVLFANSVLGALTNREGGPLALFEAITGKAYKSGVHLPQGRNPRCVIEVETPRNYMEASLTGYVVGQKCPSKIPFVKGLAGLRSNKGLLRSFLAAFGATSGAPMVILEGITPGWKRISASVKRLPKDKVIREDIRSLIHEGSDTSPYPDIYLIGCPHLSRDELVEIMKVLSKCGRYEGSSEVWLITGKLFINAEDTEKLPSNVKILTDVCPVVTRLDMLGVKHVVTDSGKALYYLPKLAKVNVTIKDRYVILAEILRRCERVD